MCQAPSHGAVRYRRLIRDLPHDLVAAFRATLAEAAGRLAAARIDAAHPNRDEQIAAVDSVLEKIGALEVPQVRVYNKIDATAIAPGIERDPSGILRAVRASALTGAGCDELRPALAELFPSHEPLSVTSAASIANV
jgi:GTP-binding protein HflX